MAGPPGGAVESLQGGRGQPGEAKSNMYVLWKDKGKKEFGDVIMLSFFQPKKITQKWNIYIYKFPYLIVVLIAIRWGGGTNIFAASDEAMPENI